MVAHSSSDPRHHISKVKIRRGPCGIHLFDRRSGLNILLDEVRVPPGNWDRSPRQVSIALTNACDLACSYCYAPKSRASLNYDRMLGWLDELDRNGCIGIGFGGGEPTLFPRLPDLCDYVIQKTTMAATLTTHGHLLTERLIAALTGKVHFIRISMDGVGETYEALRGRSFEALLRRLEAIRGVLPFGINFVVNSRTLLDLDAAAKLAASVGASDLLLLPEIATLNVAGIDERTTLELNAWIDKYRGPVALSMSERSAHGLAVCNPLADEVGLRAYAHIDAAGVLKRCSYDHDGTTIGPAGILHSLNELQLRAGGSQK